MRTLSGNFVRNCMVPKSAPARWYLLSNRTGAVIYQDYKKLKFHFVKRFGNPDGALTEGQIDSDRPGTGIKSGGMGTIHHGLDRSFFHHEAIARNFAKQLAKALEKAEKGNAYSELVLVAEPYFLGMLRDALSPGVRKKVCAEVNHEYLQGSDLEIKELVQKALS